jgi:hypothetical protein
VNALEAQEKRYARLRLLDPKLYEFYCNDPCVQAALEAYLHGHETLEKCLIIVVEALINSRKDLLEQNHKLMLRSISPILTTGDMK